MNARHLLGAALAAALATASAGPAFAQATAPANPVQPQPRDPNMPSRSDTVPEKLDSTGSTNTLSEKLGATGGVITPPGNVDPGIATRAPVPDPGTTPVIRPGSVPQQTR